MTRIDSSSIGYPVASLVSEAAPNSKRDASLIQHENQKPGALDWQLTCLRLDKADKGYRSPLIEGYCSHQSVEAGQKLQIMVSTNPPAPFGIEIFRMGYYGGRGPGLSRPWGLFQGRFSRIRPSEKGVSASASGYRPRRLRFRRTGRAAYTSAA